MEKYNDYTVLEIHSPLYDTLSHDGVIDPDVSLLLNMERLSPLNQIEVNKIFKPKDSENINDGLSDDEILQTIKPRYTQTAAEISSYTKMVENNLTSSINEKVKKAKFDAIKRQLDSDIDNDDVDVKSKS